MQFKGSLGHFLFSVTWVSKSQFASIDNNRGSGQAGLGAGWSPSCSGFPARVQRVVNVLNRHVKENL